jgi:uncharacterized RDD family membrane protein YckC
MGDESTKGTPAGLLRRLAAFLYDLLLVVALAVVATFAMLPLTRGEAILTSTQGFIGRAYHALLFAVVFGYFGWCWTRTGQTLGMKAWRMKLETHSGGRLGWSGAVGRFLLGASIVVLAILGLWYLRAAGSALARTGAALMVAPAVVNYGWMLLDSAGRSLLEVAGGTRVLRLG